MLSIQRASNSASSIITAAPAPSGDRMDCAIALLRELKAAQFTVGNRTRAAQHCC